MNSKEEILKNNGCPEIPFDENVTMYYSVILSAMDEYRSIGEQEMAIKFANWMAKNEYQDLEGHWWDGYASSKFLTTEELYQLFINQ